MKVRPIFWIVLFLSVALVPLMGPLGTALAQNANQTVGILAPAGQTTQILGTGGAVPANAYGIGAIVLGTTSTAVQFMQFYTGTVNNDTPPCTTNRVQLTQPIAVVSGVNSANVLDTIVGSPALVVPGNVALCMAVTGGAVGLPGQGVSGWITLNR